MASAGTVLVVAPSDHHRAEMTSWLGRSGFTVLEASTGEQALCAVHDEVDVIVLEAELPDVSGREVCRRIKADRATTLVPVMQVSAATADGPSGPLERDSGADLDLRAPLEPEQFVASVRALARSVESRRRADALAAQLTRLNAASLPLNAADSLAGLLEAACTGANAVFGQPALAAAEADDGRVIRVLAPGDGAPLLTELSSQEVAERWPTPAVVSAAELPLGAARLLTRAGIDPARWQIVSLRRRSGGLGGGLAVALAPGEATLDESERSMFEQLRASMQVALENWRAYSDEHRVALTLQRALLPDHLPEVPGLELRAHYLAANLKVSIGGDFYDAVPLGDGRVAVVIGDVQGHSLRAATIMAELRFSLRAYLGEGHGAAAALGLLNELMRRNHPEDTATVALLVLSADRSCAELANAGHLPPLIVGRAGTSLVQGNSPPLGAIDAEISTKIIGLEERARIVLVTDGLIERRSEPIDSSLEQLRLAVEHSDARDARELVSALLERFVEEVPDDDIALLVVERVGVPGSCA